MARSAAWCVSLLSISARMAPVSATITARAPGVGGAEAREQIFRPLAEIATAAREPSDAARQAGRRVVRHVFGDRFADERGRRPALARGEALQFPVGRPVEIEGRLVHIWLPYMDMAGLVKRPPRKNVWTLADRTRIRDA